MGSLVYGFKYPVMSPLTFLARPERWLWSIHRHGGTLTGGPNFCYELALRKVDDADIQGLDLGTWRFAFNGAEPVSPETMTAFTQRFARYGFKPEAMAPVYGLAEATLGVASRRPARAQARSRRARQLHEAAARFPYDRGPPTLTFVAFGGRIGHMRSWMGRRELPERAEAHSLQRPSPPASTPESRGTRDLCTAIEDTGDFGYIAKARLHHGRVRRHHPRGP